MTVELLKPQMEDKETKKEDGGRRGEEDRNKKSRSASV